MTKKMFMLAAGLALTFAIHATTSVAAPSVSPLTVVTLEDGRAILANEANLTVYTFDSDQPNVSNCYNGCAAAWPPVLVAETATLEAPLGFTVRKDGAHQITLNGQPLYLYVGDGAPGEIVGDGIGGIWHLVLAPQN